MSKLGGPATGGGTGGGPGGPSGPLGGVGVGSFLNVMLNVLSFLILTLDE